jgi:hypothetical protein
LLEETGGQLGSVFSGEGTFGLMITGGFRSFSSLSNGRVAGEAVGSVLDVDVGESQPLMSRSARPTRTNRVHIDKFMI